jgi:hypothetical protein
MDTHSKTKEQGKIGSGEKLDISFLVPGVYLMKLTSTQGVFGHSFIKL